MKKSLVIFSFAVLAVVTPSLVEPDQHGELGVQVEQHGELGADAPQKQHGELG